VRASAGAKEFGRFRLEGSTLGGADVGVGGALSSLNVSKHDTANGWEEFGLYSHQFRQAHTGLPEADRIQPAVQGWRLLRELL